MARGDDDFERIYWRMRLQVAGCMAFVGLVVVLAALAVGWLTRH